MAEHFITTRGSEPGTDVRFKTADPTTSNDFFNPTAGYFSAEVIGSKTMIEEVMV